MNLRTFSIAPKMIISNLISCRFFVTIIIIYILHSLLLPQIIPGITNEIEIKTLLTSNLQETITTIASSELTNHVEYFLNNIKSDKYYWYYFDFGPYTSVQLYHIYLDYRDYIQESVPPKIIDFFSFIIRIYNNISDALKTTISVFDEISFGRINLINLIKVIGYSIWILIIYKVFGLFFLLLFSKNTTNNQKGDKNINHYFKDNNNIINDDKIKMSNYYAINKNPNKILNDTKNNNNDNHNASISSLIIAKYNNNNNFNNFNKYNNNSSLIADQIENDFNNNNNNNTFLSSRKRSFSDSDVSSYNNNKRIKIDNYNNDKNDNNINNNNIIINIL